MKDGITYLYIYYIEYPYYPLNPPVADPGFIIYFFSTADTLATPVCPVINTSPSISLKNVYKD